MNDDEIMTLTLKDAAARTGLNIKKLRSAIAQGQLPAYRPGKLVLVKPGELMDYIDRAQIARPA